MGRRRLLRRTLSLAAVAVLTLLGVGIFMGGCVFAGPKYRGPTSDHFDGEQFFNRTRQERHGFGDFLRWQRTRRPGEWKDYVDAPPGPPPPHRVARGEMRVTFVNHATALIQMDGLNVLTDPHWSERASPVQFAGPRRHRPPGIRFEDLPPIDAVLISHNHYDHLDVPTLRRLRRAFPAARIFTGLGVGLLLEKEHIEGAVELDWWQSVPLNGEVTLTAARAQHFSNRGLGDQNATLWTGYALRGPSGLAYFAGDTGYGPHFQELRERLGSPRLALLPIGAFRPEWFMGFVHLSPAEAVRAAQELGAGTSVGIHFGTFRLADDGQEEPPEELRRALEAAGASAPRFWVLGFGEGRDVPP